jgi:hypothetical protein
MWLRRIGISKRASVVNPSVDLVFGTNASHISICELIPSDGQLFHNPGKGRFADNTRRDYLESAAVSVIAIYQQ